MYQKKSINLCLNPAEIMLLIGDDVSGIRSPRYKYNTLKILPLFPQSSSEVLISCSQLCVFLLFSFLLGGLGGRDIKLF